MDDFEANEQRKKMRKAIQEHQRRYREDASYREELQKKALERLERARVERGERWIKKQLQRDGLIPPERRVFFRNDLRNHKSIIEAKGGAGGFQLNIFGNISPQERRTLGLSLFHSLKPVLRYLKDFSFRHEEDPVCMKRIDERPLNASLAPDLTTEAGRIGFEIRMKRLKIGWTQQELAERASVNSKHLSEIELGLVRVRPRTLNRLRQTLASMFSQTSEDQGE